MVLFTTSFEAVHTLHTLSDYGRRTGSLHHLVQLHQSLVCFGCSSSLKLQSPLWDRAPLASQQSPSHPRQRSRRAWLCIGYGCQALTKSYGRPIRPASFPCVVKKQGGIDRRFRLYVHCLDGLSSLAMPPLSSVGFRVAMEGMVGGLDGNSMTVRLRSMKQLRLRDGICVRICLPGGAPLS